MNVDLNKTECLRTASGLLKKTVYNICSGEVHEIPYGALDIVLGVLLVSIMIGACLMFAGMMLSIIKG